MHRYAWCAILCFAGKYVKLNSCFGVNAAYGECRSEQVAASIYCQRYAAIDAMIMSWYSGLADLWR